MPLVSAYWLPALAWLGLKENFARQQAVLRMAIKSSSRVYAISVLYPLKWGVNWLCSHHQFSPEIEEHSVSVDKPDFFSKVKPKVIAFKAWLLKIRCGFLDENWFLRFFMLSSASIKAWTPITAISCQQCLPFSVVQLKGKHCWKPHCRNWVVDAFWLYVYEHVFACQSAKKKASFSSSSFSIRDRPRFFD